MMSYFLVFLCLVSLNKIHLQWKTITLGIHVQVCGGSRKVNLEQGGSTVAQQMHNNAKVNKILNILREKNVTLKKHR